MHSFHPYDWNIPTFYAFSYLFLWSSLSPCLSLCKECTWVDGYACLSLCVSVCVCWRGGEGRGSVFKWHYELDWWVEYISWPLSTAWDLTINFLKLSQDANSYKRVPDLLILHSRGIEALGTTSMGFQILIIPNTLFEKTLQHGWSGYVIMLAFKISVLILQEGKCYSDPVRCCFVFNWLYLYINIYVSTMLQFSYSAKYVKEYIEGAKPIFSVGEYWDSCNYNGHALDYNQGILFPLC